MVGPNCRKNGPLMPLTSAVGTKTAVNTTAIEIMAAPTSSMAFLVASFGEKPCSIQRSTFSTTTIASSTTIPIASTNPHRESEFSENPQGAMTARVPINDTGTAINGMSAILQDCRKTMTTITTKIMASPTVSYTASIDC